MHEIDVRPLSRLMALTARNMHRAMQETAHATLHTECDVTALVEALKDGLREGTVSGHVLYALVQALKQHPDLNAHLSTDELCVYRTIKLGLMVEAPQGVMVACIEQAGTLSRRELEAAARDRYERARDGGFQVEETRGATFLVADLSAYPVDAFTPILLPSALAILGIGRVRTVCRPVPSGGCRPAHLLSLSLTFDHRGADGLAAGRFLQSLLGKLENV